MRAYFVHDSKKAQDHMVLPDMDLFTPANRRMVADFISPRPDFSKWTGQNLKGLPPESFGRVVATREETGDVCILEESLWQQRMTMHLGSLQ